MCGRYNLTIEPAALASLFRLASVAPYLARYNIAPTQDALIIRQDATTNERHGVLLTWGLIPAWSKDGGSAARTINARSETAADKPTFRDPFLQRRCLVPATGFYEWEKRGSAKQPHHLRPPGDDVRSDAPPVWAFAGLWDRWVDQATGVARETFTILTRDAQPDIAWVHDRMPVILPPSTHAVWLDPRQTSRATLETLLRTLPGTSIATDPVSSIVNSPAHDDARCVERVDPGPRSLFEM
ncbi:MAG: SOS response-associated peptidase [Phycisphaerales bacterium]|nr:SOS response-associated peptidase [Phycisphaerales bacterium]